MGSARCKHIAGLLPDGRVLIRVLQFPRLEGNLNSAEIYDPRTGKFTARRDE